MEKRLADLETKSESCKCPYCEFMASLSTELTEDQSRELLKVLSSGQNDHLENVDPKVIEVINRYSNALYTQKAA